MVGGVGVLAGGIFVIKLSVLPVLTHKTSKIESKAV